MHSNELSLAAFDVHMLRCYSHLGHHLPLSGLICRSFIQRVCNAVPANAIVTDYLSFWLLLQFEQALIIPVCASQQGQRGTYNLKI